MPREAQGHRAIRYKPRHVAIVLVAWAFHCYPLPAYASITVTSIHFRMIKTSQLSVGYQANRTSHLILDDLNLQLKKGELVCFMGPNGIGKSTLLRTLAGLQKPLSGEIKGIDPKSIALVLTDRLSSTNMTVQELVTYGRYPYLDWNVSLTSEDEKIIENSILQVRIGHLREKKLFELSDGQMQMAMIARALAQQTSVLMLDEPTAHLDLNNRLEIMNLLRSLARNEGKAILVTTHELDLALQTADLIWLAMPDKKIKTGIPEDLVLDGSFDEVFQFKGFDLKTGKVAHEAHRGIAVQLNGEGYPLLWTKNALERCGYDVVEKSERVITIQSHENTTWLFQDKTLNSLSGLLEILGQ
jgi:iron complex transport system ATP-binding protein